MPHSVLHSRRHLCAFLRGKGADCKIAAATHAGGSRFSATAERGRASATRDHEPGVRASRSARLSRPPSSRGLKPVGFALRRRRTRQPRRGCARPPDTKTRLRRDTKTGQPLVEARKGSRGVLECLIAEIGRLFHTEPRRTRSFHLALARDAHRSGVGRDVLGAPRRKKPAYARRERTRKSETRESACVNSPNVRRRPWGMRRS